MRFYWLDCVPYESLRYTGEYRAERRWGLPGLHCPTCGGDCVGAEVYPSVDLSGLPEETQLERAWQETDLKKFERLRQLVKPLAPAWARLAPGARFGPLIGSAHGRFAQLHTLDGDTVLIRREALEQLHTEGLRALKGVRTGLRFRQRNAPELLELEMEMEMHGLFHPDCLPPGKAEPCGTCGCYGFSLPRQPLLDRASLPEHLDVFRLRNFTTVIVITERFADALQRLGFEEFSLRALPVR